MALALRKKQDDKILKLLREVANLPGNKHCFDCGEKGTTYVNSTIGSFVCTTCSGLLRGLTPPHRIKSISMATFTQEEIDYLKAHGNEECAKTWLGLWDAKRAIKQDHRDFMIDKYERKRYYLEPASPLMSIPSGRQLVTNLSNGISHHQHKTDVDNLAVLKSINLTPPSSLRLNKPPSNSQHRTQHNNHNLSDTSSTHGSPLFKTVGPRAINGHRLNNNNSSGTPSNCSTGSDATNNSANKFTPDTDFVADFSKIDIFSETVPSTNGNHTSGNDNNSKNSVVSSNNNNKNGFVMLNGGDNNNVKMNNAKNGNTGIMENFADFEHNQIYNAAEDPAQIFSNINFFGNSSSSSIQNTQNNNDFVAKSSTSMLSTTGPNVQNNNNSIFDFNLNNSTTCNTNVTQPQQQQWNYWQSFACNNNVNNSSNVMNSQQQQPQNTGWASFSSCNNFVPSPPPPESNRWSLPMSVGSVSSLSSSNTFNSSSSINSTPSADKYAALKDLDEQFKEIKILGGADASPVTNPQNNLANPFKNPSLLQSALNANTNPSPWSTNFDNNKNGIASMNGWPITNGFPTQFPTYTQTNGNGTFFTNQNQFSDFSHTNQMNGKMAGFNGTSNGTYGFGQTSNFSNPFVAQAGTVNSNNPFL